MKDLRDVKDRSSGVQSLPQTRNSEQLLYTGGRGGVGGGLQPETPSPEAELDRAEYPKPSTGCRAEQRLAGQARPCGWSGSGSDFVVWRVGVWV